MRKLTHQELLQRQNQQRHPALPFTVVLNNIRSLHNVGAIFRTADGAGIEKLWLCGITGIPPEGKISKTALGAENAVPWEFCESAHSVIRELKQKGYTIVFLEQTEKSIPYDTFQSQGSICLVVGNEIEGVQDDLLPLGDVSVEIDMAGLKNSLNVSVALGIVAYHIRSNLRKSSQLPDTVGGGRVKSHRTLTLPPPTVSG